MQYPKGARAPPGSGGGGCPAVCPAAAVGPRALPARALLGLLVRPAGCLAGWNDQQTHKGLPVDCDQGLWGLRLLSPDYGDDGRANGGPRCQVGAMGGYKLTYGGHDEADASPC